MDTIAITVDCSEDDYETVAAFWAAVLGYERVFPGYLVDPDGTRPRLAFEVVPEPKVAKNRWHVDLYVESLEALEPRVREIVELGAKVLHHIDERTHGFTNVFTTMVDPGGNEFCVCAPHLPVGDKAG
jgi:predicted enzyme related to lactoylglutathione lyase